MKSIKFLLLVLLGIFLISLTTANQINQRGALQDAWTQEESPNTNHDTGNLFNLGALGARRNIAIQFNISEVNGTATDSNLSMYLSDYLSTTTTFVYYASNQSWGESVLTYNLETILGKDGTGGDSESISGTGWFTWNITTILQKAIDNGDNNITIYLNATGGTGGNYNQFQARDGTAGRRPYVNLSFEPIPDDSFLIELISPTNNTMTSDTSINFTGNFTPRDSLNYELVNASYFIWYSNGTLFNSTTLSVTGSAENSTTLSVNNFNTSGVYSWNIYACEDNSTLINCSFASNNFTFTWIPFEVIDQIWNNNTQEGVLENYSIQILTTANRQLTQSYLWYDGTRYTGSIQGLGSGSYNITRELTTPQVSVETNKTFFWQLILDDGFSFNTTSLTQTISTFSIDDCSSFTNTLLNMTMWDEESLIQTNGTINLNVNIYSLGTTTVIAQYNKSFEHKIGQQSRICIQDINQTYSLGYSIQYYTNESYFTRYRNIQLATITPSDYNQNLSLYNLLENSGNSFGITVVGNLFSPTGNSGLLIDVQKQYLSLNEFISVESSITSSEDIAVVSLVPNSALYNFIVSYNGEILGTFNNYQVQCQNPTTNQCSIILNLAQSTTDPTDFETYGNITQTFSLNRGNSTLYQTFVSTDGNVHEVRSLVLKADGFSNTTICDNTLTGTSGTFTCTMPVIYQNSSIFVQTFVDGTYIGTKFFTQGVDVDWFGVDIFIQLLMFTAIVLLMTASPILIIVGALVGLASPIFLISMAEGSFSTILGVLIYYFVAGILAMLAIRRHLS